MYLLSSLHSLLLSSAHIHVMWPFVWLFLSWFPLYSLRANGYRIKASSPSGSYCWNVIRALENSKADKNEKFASMTNDLLEHSCFYLRDRLCPKANPMPENRSIHRHFDDFLAEKSKDKRWVERGDFQGENPTNTRRSISTRWWTTTRNQQQSK